MARRLGQLFGEKLRKLPRFAREHEKPSIWRKLAAFPSKLPWFGVWVNFSPESCENCLVSQESTKNRRFGENLQLFRANYHDSAFGSTFRQKVAKTASFRKRARKTVDLAKTCSFSEQTTMIRRLGQLFARKLQKVPHFARNHEKSSLWPKLQGFGANYHGSGFGSTFREKVGKSSWFRKKAWKIGDLAKTCNFFEQTTMMRCLGQLFGRKLQKVPHFARKHDKSSIRPKLATFSSKLPWLGVWVNFSARSCENCLVSQESTKNRRFGENLQLFRANYHDSAFGSTFRQKVAKTASFRKRARETVDLAKTCSFSEQTTMIRRLGQLFARKLQKVPHFARNHEKSSLWPKLQGFGANYHGSGFVSTFREKVGKSSWFRKKARKIGDLAKTCNFFEQTTMMRRLGQLFGRKLQKVPHFARNHEKSSLWPKLATFSSKLPWLGVWVNFSAKSCENCLVSQERTKNRRFGENLQLFRANYHDSAFGSTFRQKVAKSASFREKPRKIVSLAKVARFWSKLPWFGVWVNFSAKSWKKFVISQKGMKNRRFGQNLQLFRANYHDAVFGSTFRQKVAKSASFPEKARKIGFLPKVASFWSKLPWLGVWVNFSAKSCKKCLISRTRTKNRPFGVNLQLLPANYHGSAFGSTFRQKVAKTAPFREKGRKITDLAKTCDFFEQTTMGQRLGQLFGRKL